MSDRPRRRFVGDTAVLQATGLAAHGCQLATSVVLALLLGARGQGLYSLAVALFASVFFLLSVGVVPAAVSQLAAAHARGLDEKRAWWLAVVAKAGVVSTIVTVAAGWLLLPALARTWYGDERVGWWALVLCGQAALDLPRTVATVAFQGTRRMKALGRLDLGFEVTRAFLVAVGALATGGPEGAIAGLAAASAVGAVQAFALYGGERRDGGLPAWSEIARLVPRVPLARGLHLGLRVGLVKNAHVLVVELLPRLAIGGLAGPEYTAWLHIAQRVVGIPLVLAAAVSRNALPLFAELAATRGARALRRAFLRLSLGTAAGITACILVGLPFVPWLVSIFYPPDYVAPVTTFVGILAIGMCVHALGAVDAAWFIATSRLRLWLVLSVAGAACVLPAAAWVAVNVGTWGAAWAVVLCQSWSLVVWGTILAVGGPRSAPAGRTASVPAGTRTGRA